MIRTISSLHAQFNILEKEFLNDKDKRSYDLVFIVFISAITTVLTTVCIFCVVFESPPVRKTPPSLFKTFSFEIPSNKVLRKCSDPTLATSLEVGRSPRKEFNAHFRKHSS